MLGVNATWRYVPVERWRGDAAAVALLTFDVDAETPLRAAGDQYAAHVSTMSHQASGPHVGLPRILAMLTRRAKPATFFFPGLTSERWPDSVARVLEAGHEVALHGYAHRSPTAHFTATRIARRRRWIPVTWNLLAPTRWRNGC